MGGVAQNGPHLGIRGLSSEDESFKAAEEFRAVTVRL